MFFGLLKGESMKDKKDKNVRINYGIWSLVRAKSVELSLKTSETITIKGYIEKAIKEKFESSPNDLT